jgi:hypothetical protein
MMGIILDVLLVLFILWIVANLARYLLEKSAGNGGFWGIYKLMSREKKPVENKPETKGKQDAKGTESKKQ